MSHEKDEYCRTCKNKIISNDESQLRASPCSYCDSLSIHLNNNFHYLLYGYGLLMVLLSIITFSEFRAERDYHNERPSEGYLMGEVENMFYRTVTTIVISEVLALMFLFRSIDQSTRKGSIQILGFMLLIPFISFVIVYFVIYIALS